MTFREAWNALIGPRLRKPAAVPASGARQTTPVALPSDVMVFIGELQVERGCAAKKARRIQNRHSQINRVGK